MRGGCLLIVLALALLIGGGQGLFVGLTNPSPTALTYDEFIARRPSRGWYTVTGCRLNLLDAISRSGRLSGRVSEVYVPVTRAGGGEGPIRLVALCKDPAILDTVNDLSRATGGG